jgi:hypothetical protein
MTRDSQQIIEKNHMFCLPKSDLAMEEL